MTYKYSALSNTGKSISGVVSADSETAARGEIKARGLYLVALKEVSKDRGHKGNIFSPRLGNGLPIQLARQLSSLLKGGVPLFQALNIVANQFSGEKEKSIVRHLQAQVREGTPLSEALKGFPKMFDDLFVYAVQAGEKSGALDAILAYQADLLENRAVLKSRIKTALIYPVIMSTVGTGVLIFLMVYVVPMVMRIFERMNQQLPLPTKLLIGIATFINNYFLVLLLGSATALWLFFLWIRKNEKHRMRWESFLLKLPLYGDLYTMILVNRFTRIMETLLKSGVTMVQSILVVSRTMKNKVISNSIVKMAEMVQGGADLSAAMRAVDVFPPYVADMVSIGENSGKVEEMLARVSDYYETNVNQRIAAFTAMVEPVIILIMGAIVAFVLVSVLLPLFEMNKILGK